MSFASASRHFSIGVDLGGAALREVALDEAVEVAPVHRLLREDGGDLVPLLDVLIVLVISHAVLGGAVARRGALAAVVDGQFLEVRQDRHRELGRPRIATELVGVVLTVLDVLGRPLRLDEELPQAAVPEAVVGGLHPAARYDAVLVDDILVALARAALVLHVPAEELEERIDELLPDMRLLVCGRPVVLDISREAFDEFDESIRRCHMPSPRCPPDRILAATWQPRKRRVRVSWGPGRPSRGSTGHRGAPP